MQYRSMLFLVIADTLLGSGRRLQHALYTRIAFSSLPLPHLLSLVFLAHVANHKWLRPPMRKCATFVLLL